MRTFILLCLVCLLLPLGARAEEEFDFGPSVGGGDDQRSEQGIVPDATCAVVGEIRPANGAVLPRGGANGIDPTGYYTDNQPLGNCNTRSDL